MTSRSLFTRLIVPFAVLMSIIIAACGTVIYWAGEQRTHRQQVRDLDRLVPLVRQWVPTAGGAGDGPAVEANTRRRLTDAARVLQVRITLVGGDGRVLFDTDADAASMDNHNNRPEVRAARQGGPGTGVRYSRTLDARSVYVASLLDPGEPGGAVVRVSFPEGAWPEDVGAGAWPIVAAAIAAALLAVGILWGMLQAQWIGPTRRLAEAADRMAAGEWGRRVAAHGADELRAFSHRLNLVAAHAQKQMADLKHQRADLQSLVDTLPDPILVADAAGHLAVINSAAARLLDVTHAQAVGRGVVNVVNDEAVLQLFERVRAEAAARQHDGANGSVARVAAAAAPDRNGAGATAAPAGADAAATALAAAAAHAVGNGAPLPPGGQPPLLTREIRLKRGGQWLTYQAVATCTADGGTLLVLRDVTALAATVQMKTDFVANASHELRTPIAAIKIAFETLRDVYQEDADQAGRCLRIIDGHLHRLEEMLRDLLDMAKVESPTLKPHVRRIKAADVLAHIRTSVGPMARQKEVDLRLRDARAAATGADTFLGDERLLNLVLKNLVENSIKFTPAGGSVTVTVRDLGPGEVVAGRVAAEAGAVAGTAAAAAGANGIGAATGYAPAADAAATLTAGGGAAAVPASPPVVIAVADTGIGIPAEHLDRVFERFYQVDPARSGSAGRGTGLGLAIVKHAVAAMGGHVHIDSAVGRGTTVSCVLPQLGESPDVDTADDGD